MQYLDAVHTRGSNNNEGANGNFIDIEYSGIQQLSLSDNTNARWTSGAISPLCLLGSRRVPNIDMSIYLQ